MCGKYQKGRQNMKTPVTEIKNVNAIFGKSKLIQKSL